MFLWTRRTLQVHDKSLFSVLFFTVQQAVASNNLLVKVDRAPVIDSVSRRVECYDLYSPYPLRFAFFQSEIYTKEALLVGTLWSPNLKARTVLSILTHRIVYTV